VKADEGRQRISELEIRELEIWLTGNQDEGFRIAGNQDF